MPEFTTTGGTPMRAAHDAGYHRQRANPDCLSCADAMERADRMRADHAAGRHDDYTREHCPVCVARLKESRA